MKRLLEVEAFALDGAVGYEGLEIWALDRVDVDWKHEGGYDFYVF